VCVGIVKGGGTMKSITIEQLESLDACEEGLALFKKYCGDYIEVTEANALKVGRFLDVAWASENLLTESQFLAYEGAKATLYKAYLRAREPLYKAYEEAEATLYKAYLRAREPLYKAYEEAEATLYKAYLRAREPLYKAYEEAKAPLWEAYEEANEPLLKAYEEAQVLGFVKAYNND
tara:strand:- start:782 stop:1312 length:531 start_codon:yes stop_codon:yes gene_type:complete